MAVSVGDAVGINVGITVGTMLGIQDGIEVGSTVGMAFTPIGNLYIVINMVQNVMIFNEAFLFRCLIEDVVRCLAKVILDIALRIIKLITTLI
jgi:hypothetical protein